MHARRAIVNAAAAALAYRPTTGDRVYPGRSWPVSGESPPYLLVYARQERIDSATMTSNARKTMRLLDLIVEGVDTAQTDTDERLDTIAEEVELALLADRTLGGTCKDMTLAQTDLTVTADDNERRIAAIRLRFVAMYLTAANDPTTPA